MAKDSPIDEPPKALPMTINQVSLAQQACAPIQNKVQSKPRAQVAQRYTTIDDDTTGD